MHVDGMRRLPNDKNPAPLLVKCELVTMAQPIANELHIKLNNKPAKSSSGSALAFANVFVATGLKMGSAVTAPSWTNASGARLGDVDGDACIACLHITVHAAKESPAGEGATTELRAWGVLPLFMPGGDELETQPAATSNDDQYLNTGRFQLPLFSPAKTLRTDLVESFAKRAPDDATAASSLKQFLKRKQVLALEGASAFVRIVDLQLPPELQPTSKSPEDLCQLGIGPPKRSYTAPVDKGQAKSTFAATRPKKEGEEEFDARIARLLARAEDDLIKKQDMAAKEAALEAAMTPAKKKTKKKK